MAVGSPQSLLTPLDTFKAKIQECGKSCSDFRTDLFFTAGSRPPSSGCVSGTNAASKAPPRLVSDQMINIFFQEWAPLFPVLHRPTYLKIYTDYVVNPEGLHGQQAIAQLNLVFGIAALSAEVCLDINCKTTSVNSLSLVESSNCGGFREPMANCG